MTERHFKVSLSKLYKNKKFVAMAGEEIYDYRLFQINYRNIDGLPAYDVEFGEDDDCDAPIGICANNLPDIISALRRDDFDVVAIP